MYKTPSIKQLGTVLQQADLVSSTQVKIALQEQSQSRDKRIGEILARRGWLKQETADFFAEQWPNLLSHRVRQPLGQYLKKAALLSDRQVETLLLEQKQTNLRFGELAVKRGWLKPTTIDFFLNYLGFNDLYPQNSTIAAESEIFESNDSLKSIRQGILENQHCEPFRLLKLYRQILRHKAIADYKTPELIELTNLDLLVKKGDRLIANPIYEKTFNLDWVEEELARLRPFNEIRIKLFKLETKASSPYSVLEEILFWTGEQFYLTQKLCQLISESEVFIAAGKEAMRVEQIVQKNLIENWEMQAAAEPLRIMEQQLLENQQCDPLSLLKLYRQILLKQTVLSDDSAQQTELLNLGLIVQPGETLSVANRIYEKVFNLAWVEKKLLLLHPWNEQLWLYKLDPKASSPYSLLEEILFWTGGQFDLTQKLCHLVSKSDTFIAAGEEAMRVRQIIQDNLIDNWEAPAAEPLRVLRQQLLENRQCNPLSLLKLYRKILQQQPISTSDRIQQVELLNLGLIVSQGEDLSVANPIYEMIFNLAWVEKELVSLHPWNEALQLFKLEEKASSPYNVLNEILAWTGGQLTLTQTLFNLVVESPSYIQAGIEAMRVEQIVKENLINNWETQPAAESLRVLQQQLLENQQCDSLSLLKLYRQILRQGDITADDSPEQRELLNLGLIVVRGDRVTVSNRIYETVFNRSWVTQDLEQRLQQSLVESTVERPLDNAASVIPTAKRTRKKKASRSAGTFVSPILFGLGIAGTIVFGVSIYNFLMARALFEQGNILFNEGKNQEAIATYDDLLKHDSNYYQAWTNRGYALARLRDYEKMLESCKTATIIEPKAIYAWNCQGEALHNLKRYDEAIAAFDKGMALDSHNPVFSINKTESLLKLGNINEALDAIDRAIELLKQNNKSDGQELVSRELSVAFNSKAKILLQQEEHEEALNAYDSALSYAPNYFAASQGRGVALRKLRRYDEAIAQFNQLLDVPKQTDDQKAETLYYLGLTLNNLDRTQEAIAAFDEALNLKPNYQQAIEARQRIVGY
ncbi:MAG: tetratricopeptide repeat protein [Hydrococcus sp. Prado102]|nr:tetratricopeptide repeat protein [Hydrococcus sp. Prado102]